MMPQFMESYCPLCDTKVNAILQERDANLVVRGEDVEFIETVAVCPFCGEMIGDARIEGENLERAYAIYRARHGIMSPSEIRALRLSYGLSLREFSKFLGFGEQTVYRYEHGGIPDQTHSMALKSAESFDGASRLLAENKDRLSSDSVASIEQTLRSLVKRSETALRSPSVLEVREGEAPSPKNGFRPLDLSRVFSLIHLLAQKCKNLYWTKLQKALFFADMAYYERNGQSLTGLTYAHATFGPVVDQREELRCLLIERGVVTFQEHGWGEVLLPLPWDGGVHFESAELEVIDEVTAFVNSFTKASELSDYSHRLNCWKSSVDGQLIDYADSSGEVNRALRERKLFPEQQIIQGAV